MRCLGRAIVGACAVLVTWRSVYAQTSAPPPDRSKYLQATRRVYGRIVDAANDSIATQFAVRVAGTTLGTATGSGRRFELRGAPLSAIRLVVSHPCYFSVEIAVPAGDSPEIRVGMPFDASSRQRPGCGGLGARR